MRVIKIYDSEITFKLGEAHLRIPITAKLPPYVLWHGRVYKHYHGDQYREITIEPAFDAESGEDEPGDN